MMGENKISVILKYFWELFFVRGSCLVQNSMLGWNASLFNGEAGGFVLDC